MIKACVGFFLFLRAVVDVPSWDCSWKSNVVPFFGGIAVLRVESFCCMVPASAQDAYRYWTASLPPFFVFENEAYSSGCLSAQRVIRNTFSCRKTGSYRS